MRQIGHGTQVDQVERGIRRCLQEDSRCAGLQRIGPFVEVCPLHQHTLDPETRQDLGQDVMATAEQCA